METLSKSKRFFPKPKTGFQDHLIWEYVMRDFLEIHCALENSKQQYLLKELMRFRAVSPNIEEHCAFSSRDILVTTVTKLVHKQFWLFCAETGSIYKVKLPKKNQTVEGLPNAQET